VVLLGFVELVALHLSSMDVACREFFGDAVKREERTKP
jgi:hypothetical protein